MKKTGFEMKETEDGEIVMRGMLTVENASAIRSGILNTLRRRDSLKISIEAAQADVSFLQILCAAHRLARTEKKDFLKGDFSDDFVSSILQAGYARNRGCSPGGETNCLWILGGENE